MEKVTIIALDKNSSKSHQMTLSFNNVDELEKQILEFEVEVQQLFSKYYLDADTLNVSKEVNEVLNEFGIV